jgi:hypothetical protein
MSFGLRDRGPHAHDASIVDAMIVSANKIIGSNDNLQQMARHSEQNYELIYN